MGNSCSCLIHVCQEKEKEIEQNIIIKSIGKLYIINWIKKDNKIENEPIAFKELNKIQDISKGAEEYNQINLKQKSQQKTMLISERNYIDELSNGGENSKTKIQMKSSDQEDYDQKKLDSLLVSVLY